MTVFFETRDQFVASVALNSWRSPCLRPPKSYDYRSKPAFFIISTLWFPTVNISRVGPTVCRLSSSSIATLRMPKDHSEVRAGGSYRGILLSFQPGIAVNGLPRTPVPIQQRCPGAKSKGYSVQLTIKIVSPLCSELVAAAVSTASNVFL